MSTGSPIRVLIDEIHGELGRTNLNFSKVYELLNNKNYHAEILEDEAGSITLEKLRSVHALLLGAPCNKHISKVEIVRILRFIQYGGGLILLSTGWGDKALKSNLNQLAQYMGVAFNNDFVSGGHAFSKGRNILKFKVSEIPSHIINTGLHDISYAFGCSLRTNKTPSPILSSTSKLKPPLAPLIVSTLYDQGRVILSGSFQMFQDGGDGGIEAGDNEKLFLNMVRWVSKAPPFNPVPQRTKEISNLLNPFIEKTPNSALPNVISTKLPLMGIPINNQNDVVADKKLPVQMEVINSRLISLENTVNTGFETIRNLIRNTTALIKETSGMPISQSERSDSSLGSDDEVITPLEAQQGIKEAENEKRSLMELLDYITQRFHAGALTSIDYEEQRKHLVDNVHQVDSRIARLSQYK